MPDSPDQSSLGSAPIPGDSPVGVSAKYETEYETLTAEIAKLESVEGRGSIRWKDVVELATTILSEKSKDLLIASYLSMGRLQVEGYAGLAGGLQVIKDLLNTYWENLFPEKKRMRGRAGALQWLSDRAGAALGELPDPDRSDEEPLNTCSTILDEIKSFASSNFDGNDPDLSELSRAVQEKIGAVPSAEPEPSTESSGGGGGGGGGSDDVIDSPFGGGGEAEPSSDGSSAPAAAGGATIQAMDSPESARQALAELRQQAVQAAAVIRGADPKDPLSYRLTRRAAWEDLFELPAAVEGVTELIGGDAEFASRMEDLLAKEEYETVLSEAEDRVATDVCWLDTSFWVVQAMEGLGRPYKTALKCVADEVGALIRRLPGLLDLKFSDGTGFAGEKARVWMSHELGAVEEQAGAQGSSAVEKVLKDARKLVARNKLAEAAAMVQKEVQGLTDRRDRFIGRLQLAKLCLEAGKHALAVPQLLALDEEAQRFGIEEWEPGLAVDLARELWKGHKAAGSEKAEEYYARLSRLDLSAALAVGGKK